MINWTEISDGETWEQFARDFLESIGLKIEIEPGRGQDRGRDIVISERLQGLLHGQTFRWLVSCKHYAGRGSAVGTEEADISDRCKRNQCHGFMGFYSTVASANLIDRLEELKREGQIESSRIFDGRAIESQIVARGMTKLVLRYIPLSFAKLRPIQKLFGDHIALRCFVCQRDVLTIANPNEYKAIIVSGMRGPDACDEAHVVCKGKCDDTVSAQIEGAGLVTAWQDVTDLYNPLLFLRFVIAYANQLHTGKKTFSEQAHGTMKDVIMAVAQRTLRDISKEDEDKFAEYYEYGELGL